MKLSACTVIKNANIFDFPIIESINSVLDQVDNYYINIGLPDEDKTIELLEKNFKDNSKVHLIKSTWDMSRGTSFISEQTNFIIDHVEDPWILLLQADECINDRDASRLKNWCERADLEGADGVVFNYLHFEKDYNHLRKGYSKGGDAYDYELRLIKNNGQLHSFGDGQSFCYTNDLLDPRGPQPCLHRPDRFLFSDMNIYHYSYAGRNPKTLLNKKKYLDKFYKISEPGRNEQILDKDGGYVYNEDLLEFKGEHPSSMKDRIERFNRGLQ